MSNNVQTIHLLSSKDFGFSVEAVQKIQAAYFAGVWEKPECSFLDGLSEPVKPINVFDWSCAWYGEWSGTRFPYLLEILKLSHGFAEITVVFEDDSMEGYRISDGDITEHDVALRLVDDKDTVVLIQFELNTRRDGTYTCVWEGDQKILEVLSELEESVILSEILGKHSEYVVNFAEDAELFSTIELPRDVYDRFGEHICCGANLFADWEDEAVNNRGATRLQEIAESFRSKGFVDIATTFDDAAAAETARWEKEENLDQTEEK